MKSTAIVRCAALIAVLFAATSAPAGHGHCGGGPRFGFGISFSPAPYYYAPPVYAYPYPYAYPAPYAYPYPYYAAAPAPPAAAAPPTAYSQSTVPLAPKSSASTAPSLASTPSTSSTPTTASRVTFASKGTFDIYLPDSQGEVWVDGRKLGGTGAKRTYRDQTAKDSSHTYKVTAAWQENGQLVTEERLVAVKAGQQPAVDFTQPDDSPESVPPLPQPYQKQR